MALQKCVEDDGRMLMAISDFDDV